MKIVKIVAGIVLLLLVVVFIFAKMNSISPLSMVSSDAVYTTDGAAIGGYDACGILHRGNGQAWC